MPDWAEYVDAVIDVEDTYDSEEMEYFLYSRKVGIPFSDLNDYRQTLLYLVHLAAHLWQQSEDEEYPFFITQEFYNDGLSGFDGHLCRSGDSGGREGPQTNAGIPIVIPQQQYEYA